MTAQLKARKPLAAIGKRRPKCKVCAKPFTKTRQIQPVCGNTDCAVEWLKRKEVEKRTAPYRPTPAKNTKERRAMNAKSKPKQLALTQTAFNALRREQCKGDACISCGITYGKMNAGHYRSVGSSPELRYEPMNVWLQCEQCNTSKSGNVGPYRIGLIAKIGIEKVEWLEGPHDAKHYTCGQLIEMRAEMRAELRRLQAMTEV